MEKRDEDREKLKVKKKFAEFSEIFQVPLHRAYGVTKRETWLSHFNEHLATLLLILLYASMFIMLALGAYMLIRALGAKEVVGASLAITFRDVYRTFEETVY